MFSREESDIIVCEIYPNRREKQNGCVSNELRTPEKRDGWGDTSHSSLFSEIFPTKMKRTQIKYPYYPEKTT